MPLHVSSTMCSSSGGQNCIIQHLVSSPSVGDRPVRSNCIIQHPVSSHSVGGRPVHRLREDLCTGRSPTGVMISDAV